MDSNSGLFSTGTFSTGTNPAGSGVFRSRALVVLATAAVVGLLWAGKVLFVMFFFALFLSFALQPFVTLLERLRFPRSLAVLLVILFLSALLVFFVVNAMSQIEAFTRDLPTYETRIRIFTAKAQGVFAQLEERTRLLLPEVDRSTRSVRLESDAFDSLSKVAVQVKTLVSLLLYTAAVPMLSFFMLKDREKYGGAVVKILRIKGGRAAQDFAVGVARVLSDTSSASSSSSSSRRASRPPASSCSGCRTATSSAPSRACACSCPTSASSSRRCPRLPSRSSPRTTRRCP